MAGPSMAVDARRRQAPSAARAVPSQQGPARKGGTAPRHRHVIGPRHQGGGSRPFPARLRLCREGEAGERVPKAPPGGPLPRGGGR